MEPLVVYYDEGIVTGDRLTGLLVVPGWGIDELSRVLIGSFA